MRRFIELVSKKAGSPATRQTASSVLDSFRSMPVYEGRLLLFTGPRSARSLRHQEVRP